LRVPPKLVLGLDPWIRLINFNLAAKSLKSFLLSLVSDKLTQTMKIIRRSRFVHINQTRRTSHSQNTQSIAPAYASLIGSSSCNPT
jgi:hypothetical protein